MLIYRHVVRDVASLIAGAVSRSVEALREGRVEQEPQMTDRMLGAIEECLHGYVAKGLRWTAKTLTDRGRGAQESEFGADFMGVLRVDLPELRVTKGFLAQAKLVKGYTSGDRRTLTGQCEKMLAMTPDSFVFLYYPDGVRVVPAISVVGSSEDPSGLYSRSARTFFEDHLECFIGDRAISAASPQTLEALRERLRARTGLFLEAREGQSRDGTSERSRPRRRKRSRLDEGMRETRGTPGILPSGGATDDLASTLVLTGGTRLMRSK